MESHYEYDDVQLLSPVAVGKPGKRTFFLVIGDKQDWIRLWLEKEQLQALAMASGQLLDTISKEFHRKPGKADTQSAQGEKPTRLPVGEFDIEQMNVGYDQEHILLDFMVHPIGPQRDLEITVECRSTLEQFKWLGKEADRVCAAGRPICKICGYPIDPEGHVCPETD